MAGKKQKLPVKPPLCLKISIGSLEGETNKNKVYEKEFSDPQNYQW